MRVLIVDDEPPARARLCSMLAEISAEFDVDECVDGVSALEYLRQNPVDVILLDIRMPGMDGLEVAHHLTRIEPAPAVIFTTAYDSHALAAFEAQALDYLLKPIRRERLAAALRRARTITRTSLDPLSESIDSQGPRTHISATVNGNLRLVPLVDVRYFRAEHKYVTARYLEGELVLDDPLAKLEEEFGERLLRVHRNALVSREHLSAVTRDAAGRYCVRFVDVDDAVEVSRRLLAKVRKVLLEC